jgi:hypothetical protein
VIASMALAVAATKPSGCARGAVASGRGAESVRSRIEYLAGLPLGLLIILHVHHD